MQLTRKTRKEARGGGYIFVLLNENEAEEFIEEAEDRDQHSGKAAAIIVTCNPKELEDKKKDEEKQME